MNTVMGQLPSAFTQETDMTVLHLLPGQEKSPAGPRESAPSGSRKSGQPHPRFH